ncbi:MAG: Hsp20/alpha crystallin family protein [Alphaproteobacteria bacterium]
MARNLPSLFGSTFPTAFPSAFGDMRREMDRVFDDFGFVRPSTAGNGGFAMPATEVREDDTQFVIAAELPGLKKDDIEIDVHDGVLTIKAEKKAAETKEEDNVHYSERRYGTYRRDFRLGENVDLESIAADFADGVLTVKLPKTAPAEPEKKRIQIGG